MRRIAIVGNSGSGKSTLARRLGEKLGLPVIHLDVLFWAPGWTESGQPEFRARLVAAMAADAWVSDGNFDSSWDLRLPRIDTMIWIEQPRWLCLLRAIWRVAVYRRADRPDMADGCDEKLDLAFYRYIWTWEREMRPGLEAGLATYGAHMRVIRLKGDREIATFLASLT